MSPTKNRILGLFLMLLGIGLAGYGMYLGNKALADRTKTFEAKVNIAPVTKNQCKAAMLQHDFIAQEAGIAIQAKRWGLDEPKLTLYQASLVLMQCPGYKLTSFCMGKDAGAQPGAHPPVKSGTLGCSIKGTTFTLSPAR